MEGREGRESRRQLAPFLLREGMGSWRGRADFLEHLEDRCGGLSDPRLKRRGRVKPVTASDLVTLGSRRVVVCRARCGSAEDGQE
jgi:hypothetical protein